MIPNINTDKYDREYCALLTTYKPDSLEVDYEAFRKLVRYFTTDTDFLKIRGSLIVVPEAGEIYYLTQQERDGLIKIVMEERHPDMPIFAGCYGVRRDDLIDSALHAKALGVDGMFILPPAGFSEVSLGINGSENPEIWTNHVKAIAQATELPLIVHPSHPHTERWGHALPIESVKMILEEVPSVVGWKMIYGNAAAHFRIARYIRSLPRHVALLNSPHFCHHTAVLCRLLDGGVKGAYNFNKEGLIEHTLAWSKGDMKSVEHLWNNKVMPIGDFIYGNSRSHIRYKLFAWIRGLISHPFMRPPMPPPRREEAETAYEIIKKTGLNCISRSEFEGTLGNEDKILVS